MSEDRYADVMESLQRCLGNEDFLYRFYDVLIERRPEVAQLFRETDFDAQTDILRHALTSAIAFAGGTDIADSVLYRIGRTHGAYGMRIDSELYPHWIDALLQAVREYDSQVTPELQARWRTAMDVAVERIHAHGQPQTAATAS